MKLVLADDHKGPRAAARRVFNGATRLIVLAYMGAPPVRRAYAAPPGPRSPSTVGAIMLETNHEWTVARRYVSLETLARVNDSPNVRVPAVAT